MHVKSLLSITCHICLPLLLSKSLQLRLAFSERASRDVKVDHLP